MIINGMMMTAIALPKPWGIPDWLKIGLAGLLGIILMFSTATSNLFNVTVTVPAGSLTYQEGGDPGDETDPALDVDAASRRYICSIGGSDANTGLTQAQAWATINKIAPEWAGIPSNAIIVLCRGGTWGASSITNKAGTTDSPTAIGAYGACTASAFFDNICSNAPRITGDMSFNQSSWLTVRDLSVRRFDTSFGSHHILVYRNQGKGPEGVSANVFRSFGASHHMVFVENIATDATGNDYFSAHRDSGAGRINNRDGWWYIDNICLGNGGEDCIDLANAEVDDGFDQYVTLDSKVIANRFLGQGLVGYSTQVGTPAKCNNSGHEGKYYWWVGNICLGWTGSNQWNFARDPGTGKDAAQISGNFIIGDVSSNTDMFRNFATNQNIFHNTLIQNGTTGNVSLIDGNSQKYDYNISVHQQTNTEQIIDTVTADGQITSMNNNWYGLATGKIITDGETLAQRQVSTSFDANSDEGAITGFTMPTAATYPNPNTWRDAAFLDDITPSVVWSGCDGANTPGARDCTGNYIGWELNVITGADNGGCGWDGLPIVPVKLAELGVTGDCV